MVPPPPWNVLDLILLVTVRISHSACDVGRVTGFKLWMEHNQTVFAEENPELPEGDLVKIALKKWRSLDDNEKGDWNEKAKKATESLESEDKKRKRENEENDENRTTKTQKPENTSKKLKSDSLSASAKLAGFAFSKN